MFLIEIDPESSINEILTTIGKLLADLENGQLDTEKFLEQIQDIYQDVNLRKTISLPTPKEAFQWDFLVITIKNILDEFGHN